tara:strand:- start:3147 stop:3656 length:510 start_codon:yes stop_codon:yes gene_type:complete
MVFNSRLGQKIKKGLKLGLKIGAGALAVGGAIALGSKAKNTAELQVSNAQTLGEQAVQGGQAVVGAGVLGGQSEAKKQTEKLGVLTNLGLSGQNLKDITKAQREQQTAETLPAVNPNLLSGMGRTGGFGGGSGSGITDDEVARAVRIANCQQKYGGSGIRYKRCLKTGN